MGFGRADILFFSRVQCYDTDVTVLDPPGRASSETSALTNEAFALDVLRHRAASEFKPGDVISFGGEDDAGCVQEAAYAASVGPPVSDRSGNPDPSG